jgi:hypothetical protein
VIPGRATTLLSPWARELMQLVREYGKAKQNLANYSGEERDLAWTAAEAAHERILKKVYDKVDVSIREEDRHEV